MKAGLDNGDATLAQNIIQIHANPAFSSINLGQAVLLVAYEWFTSGPVPEVVVAGDSLPATLDEVAYFENRLEAELLDKGFLKPPEKRPSMMRNLRNIFRRADLTGQEIRSLHGVISALIRREGDADD